MHRPKGGAPIPARELTVNVMGHKLYATETHWARFCSDNTSLSNYPFIYLGGVAYK